MLKEQSLHLSPPLPHQNEALQQVMDVLGCNRGLARALLIHFRWSPETLFGERPPRFLLASPFPPARERTL